MNTPTIAEQIERIEDYIAVLTDSHRDRSGEFAGQIREPVVVRDIECLNATLTILRGLTARPDPVTPDELMAMLEYLREEEGHTVTLGCDNPDFNSDPNCAVDCCGDYTGWQDKRFTGDTLAECLAKAVEAKRAFNLKQV